MQKQYSSHRRRNSISLPSSSYPDISTHNTNNAQKGKEDVAVEKVALTDTESLSPSPPSLSETGLTSFQRFDNSDINDMARMSEVNEFLQNINPSIVSYPPITNNGYSLYPRSDMAKANEEEIKEALKRSYIHGGLGSYWSLIKMPRISIPDPDKDEGATKEVTDWLTLRRGAQLTRFPSPSGPIARCMGITHHLFVIVIALCVIGIIFYMGGVSP